MPTIGGNNVSYGSGGYYEAQIYYAVSYPSPTTYEVDWKLQMFHNTSLYDSTNKGYTKGELAYSSGHAYGSKSISDSNEGTVVYASGTKTGTRSYTSAPTLTQTFWVEDFAEFSGGGERSTVTVNIVIAKTPPAKPSKPATPTVTDIGQDRATVNMVLPASNGAIITNTILQIFAAPTGGSYLFTDGVTDLRTSNVFDDLNPNTTYYAQVQATNSVGTSDPSARKSFKTTALVAPSKPAAPTVSSITNTNCVVTMVDPATNGSTITARQMLIERASDGANVTDSSGTSLSRTLGGLAVGNNYTARVRVNSDAGYSAWSNTTAFSTPPAAPDKPTSLKVSKDVAGTRFDWTPPADDGGDPVDKYQLQVHLNAAWTDNVITIIPGGPAYIAPYGTLPYDTQMWWRVSAHNSAGYGAWQSGGSFYVDSTGGIYYFPEEGGPPVRAYMYWFNEAGEPVLVM